MFNSYYDAKLHKKAHPELRFFDRKKTALASAKHVHIIGICGTAMGTFALMLRDSGFRVSGSDAQFWPPMGPLLRSSGVEIFEGWNAENIASDVDLVIVGNACGPTHVEVVAARERGLALMSMPEVLGEYFVGDDKESLVVAGTHGKTTTTGLLAHVLSSIGEDPTYLIGGVTQKAKPRADAGVHTGNGSAAEGTSHHVGKGRFVALEGDEYDTAFFDARPKFLHYRPSYSIITSVEWDHVDIYSSIEEYKTAFAHLIDVTQKGLVISAAYPLLNSLIESVSHRARVLTYGMNEGADLRPVLGAIDENGQRFELFVKGISAGTFTTPMYGEYNMLNTVAVLGVLHQAGFDIGSDGIKDAIASFPGMKRRQEIVNEILIKTSDLPVTIIDDFAHHPTAVHETLKGIRNRFPGRRIVALFEPRSNTSRRKMFEHTYPAALAIADLVGIKTPPYRAEVDAGQDLLDPHVIERDIQALGREVVLTDTTEDLVQGIVPLIMPGDVIVVMSNGAFDGIHGKIAYALL